jgi:lysophospholipase L1-like esterase
MKNEKGAKPLAYLFLMLIFFSPEIASANKGFEINKKGAPPHFELSHGDRVVFLGNSLFENELQYGYLEFALTTRWPDRDITFRNLGWSGDTVFGEARSYYTTPPTPYELMIQQLRDAKPTVVFLAYGANESEGGEAGIPTFTKGLLDLLEKIEELGAQTVLFSPIPLISSSPSELFSTRNNSLKLYSSAIEEMALDQEIIFVDVMDPLQDLAEAFTLSDDGVHLNGMGYYYLALLMEKELGLSSREWSIIIDTKDQQVESTIPVNLLSGNQPLQFRIKEEMLPLPLPDPHLTAAPRRILKVEGLKKGFYSLSLHGNQVITVSAKKLSEGIEINQGAPFQQSHQLLDLIIQKNNMFFQQYRPLNRTYIIGFRSYEQGRHVKGLEDLNIIIDYLEGQIKEKRVPQSNVYQLTAIN